MILCHKESQDDHLSSLPRFLAVQHSVQVIQKRWRETLIARKQRTHFLRFRKSVVHIQALWRGLRVRDSLQKVTVLCSQVQCGLGINIYFIGMCDICLSFKDAIYLCLVTMAVMFDLYWHLVVWMQHYTSFSDIIAVVEMCCQPRFLLHEWKYSIPGDY